MKIEIVSMKSIMTNRDSLHNYFGWPSVARLRDGRLAAVASGFRVYHKCPFGKGAISFSADEGQTWSLPAVVIDTPLDDRDCGIVPFGESSVMVTCFNNGPFGDAFLHCAEKRKLHGNYIQGYLDLMREEKNLESYWGSVYRISHDNGVTFGELKVAPVTCPHGPALLSDGSFLYVGNPIGPNMECQQNISCYRMSQDGNFTYLCDIESPGDAYVICEPHAIALESGKIIVHIRVEQSGKVETSDDVINTTFQCESWDGGKSFTKPHAIEGMDIRGGCPAHLINDNGVLISVAGHRWQNPEIRAMFSFDEGENWDTDYVVAHLPDRWCDHGYPSSVVLKDGSILTVFYGSDEGLSGEKFWAGKNSEFHEFATPVIRQVIWRYDRFPANAGTDPGRRA